jgi:hypothetical protein
MISHLLQRSLSVTAAVAVLAGCSAGSQLAPLNTASGPSTVHSDRNKSWMEPGAKKGALLYGANFSTNDVDVYTYPQGKLTGTLTGFNEPSGECADATGNVFIANTGTSQILEYAHGGSTPIATLNDPGQYPVSCSSNPQNGDLAVSNILSTSGSGSVSIYKKAHGTPKIFSDSNFYRMEFLGYDGKGNLFVDGSNASGLFQYAELPKGRKSFTDIALNQSISFPGSVQYDGKYMAIGDQIGSVIYQTLGAKVVGMTTLGGATEVSTFFILGKKLLCPSTCNADLATYKYPAGGSPIKTLMLSNGAPGVVVVSN